MTPLGLQLSEDVVGGRDLELPRLLDIDALDDAVIDDQGEPLAAHAHPELARIHLQAFAFAFAGTAVLSLTYGFLQNAGFPDANWAWVWPLMGTLWIIGKLIAKRKYQ